MANLALDVHYDGNQACVAGVLFEHWASDAPSHVFTKLVSVEADYQSGAFYLRELPCLLSLISDITFDISTVIVDGYIQLGHPPRPGMGERLYNEIKIPVIGVAKKYFNDTPSSCELFRGVSKHPLYVTSIGVDQSAALKSIKNMHGKHRIPTLLNQVDRLSRNRQN